MSASRVSTTTRSNSPLFCFLSSLNHPVRLMFFSNLHIIVLPTPQRRNHTAAINISSQCLFIKYSYPVCALASLTFNLVFLNLTLSLCLLTKQSPNERPPPKSVNIGKNNFFENYITKLNRSKPKKDLKDIHSLIPTIFF